MDDAETRKAEALERLLWMHPTGVQKGGGLHRKTANALVKEGWATVNDFYDDVWPPRPIMAKDKNWEAQLTPAGIQEAFRRGYELHTEERCVYSHTCDYHTPHIQNRIAPPVFRQATEGTIEMAQPENLIPVRITNSVMDNVFTETETWQKDDGEGTVHQELKALAENWVGTKPIVGKVTVDTLGWMLDMAGYAISLEKVSGAQSRAAQKFIADHQEAFDAAGGVEQTVAEARAAEKPPVKSAAKKTAPKKSGVKQPERPEAPQRGVMVKGADGLYRLPILNRTDVLLGWTVYADPKGKPVRNEDV